MNSSRSFLHLKVWSVASNSMFNEEKTEYDRHKETLGNKQAMTTILV